MKRLIFILSIALYLNTNAQIITTVAGNGNGPGVGIGDFGGDGGQATSAELNIPTGVIIDATGNLYISDYWNERIRKVNTSGIITTFAGNGTDSYSGDGGQATNAELSSPMQLAIDRLGNLYFAALFNNRIRKIDSQGIITTVAGNGTASYSGDGGQATNATLNEPSGVTIDSSGNLYIADTGNNLIRKVNTSGIISTVVGNGTHGFNGDGGQATDAELNYPSSITLDATGNLYIVDAGNGRIRKVNNIGIISTIAGTSMQGFSGDGGQATNATLSNPSALAIDSIGNLYISDEDNYRIRMVNTSGIISTIAGNGTRGFSGDGGQATDAELFDPKGLILDNLGNLYVADNGNSRIRKVTNVASTGISQYSNLNTQISIYPNPSGGVFTIETNSSTKQTMQVYDVNGRVIPIPNPSQREGNKLTIDLSNLPTGVYNINITSNEGVVNKRVVISK